MLCGELNCAFVAGPPSPPKPFCARAGDRADRARLGIDLADELILHLDEQHVARFIEPHFIRLIELRLRRRPAVARIALCAAAGDGRQFARS